MANLENGIEDSATMASGHPGDYMEPVQEHESGSIRAMANSDNGIVEDDAPMASGQGDYAEPVQDNSSTKESTLYGGPQEHTRAPSEEGRDKCDVEPYKLLSREDLLEGLKEALLVDSKSPSEERQEQCNVEPSKLFSREELLAGLKEALDAKYTESAKAKAWADTADVVKQYSDEMVERWNREIDSLLTFAGLFSAVLTAFNVESYQLLQPASTDQTTAVLIRMSSQLACLTANAPPANCTAPSYAESTGPPSHAPTYAVWLNGLWFSSLILSISSAFIGITVKQWLSEFKKGQFANSRVAARLRQHRLESLVKWRVATIVAVLPVLLLISLLLFLAGLLVMLQELHHAVAATAAVFVAALLLFTSAVTVFPVIYATSCSYRSPQGWIVLRIWESFMWEYRGLFDGIVRSLEQLAQACSRCVSVRSINRWVARWVAAREYDRKYFRKPGRRDWSHYEFWRDVSSEWHTPESDIHMSLVAYMITMDTSWLETAPTWLFRDNLHVQNLQAYSNQIDIIANDTWGTIWALWPVNIKTSHIRLYNRILQHSLVKPVITGHATGPMWTELKRVLSFTDCVESHSEVLEEIILDAGEPTSFLRTLAIISMWEGYDYISTKPY